jgi:hypothetical protein
MDNTWTDKIGHKTQNEVKQKTQRADIDLTLKADPLPDSKSSDSSDDQDIINMLVNQI